MQKTRVDSRKDLGRYKAMVLLGVYFLFFAVYTVFTRSAGLRRWNFTPFWEYRYALAGAKSTFHYLVINILLCIPMGYLASRAFEEKKKWQILLIVTGYSVLIEAIQLVTGRGLCEFDDIFNNTLGGAIGMLCYFGPLEFFDAAAATIVYGAGMVVMEFTTNRGFAFWRVPKVLVHTYILYLPAHAILTVFIFKLFGLYDNAGGRTGRQKLIRILLANFTSVLSKILIQYFFFYSFSVSVLYYTSSFILQCILTLGVRRDALHVRRQAESEGPIVPESGDFLNE